MIGNFEIKPGESRKIELTQYFEPDEFFFPAGLSLNAAPDGKIIYMMRVKGCSGLQGRRARHQVAEDRGAVGGKCGRQRVPAICSPAYRSFGFPNIAPTGRTQPMNPKSIMRDIVKRLAPKAFRRPVTDAEIESFVSLAKPHHPKEQAMHKMVRSPLRAMFSSPQFLFPWWPTRSCWMTSPWPPDFRISFGRSLP